MQLARSRPPLLVTGLTLSLLLFGPWWWLARHPRLHAAGLERLAASAALLQSFRSGGQQPPPALWSRRLGTGLAQQLWARHSGLWWQFWGGHGDGAEFLALPAEAFGGIKPLPLPPTALQVDDLVVVAADPLNRQWLQDQLRLKFAPPQGLQRHCLNGLKNSVSVYWSGPTLGELLGPLTPLFLPFQQGCFVLAADGKALLWQGQASPLGPSQAGTDPGGSLLAPPAQQPANTLLLLQGGRLAPLVDGLLASRLVSEPLQKRYGLGPSQLGQLRQAPFQLRLRSEAKGPYQASLELHLALGGGRAADWQALLEGLRKGLLAQGLEEREATHPQWQRQTLGDRYGASTWQRADSSLARSTSNGSTVVGGWRWQHFRPGTSQSGTGPDHPQELVLFLGPEPTFAPASSARLASWDPAQGRTDQLSLWAQPQALARLGLWPTGLPPLLKRSSSLQIDARAVEAGGWSSGAGSSQLAGRLELPLSRSRVKP